MVAAGHEVLVIGPAALAARAEEWSFALGDEPDPEVVGVLWAQAFQLPAEEVRELVGGEIFTRHNAGAMLEPVAAAIEEFRPDLLVRDPMEWASAVCAARAGVQQVRVAISLACAEQAMLSSAGPILEEWEPGVTGLIEESPYLTRFPVAIDPAVFPDSRRFRLDETVTRAADPEFVYATLGTEAPQMAAVRPWYDVLADALGKLPGTAMLTVGRVLDPASIQPQSPNVEVCPWADHADVLARAAVTVHHGGSGTTLDALAVGCPQVVVPLFADQGENAEAVARVGVGVAAGSLDVPLRTPVEGDLELVRNSVERVLVDEEVAERAAAVAVEMALLPELDLAMLGEGFKVGSRPRPPGDRHR